MFLAQNPNGKSDLPVFSANKRHSHQWKTILDVPLRGCSLSYIVYRELKSVYRAFVRYLGENTDINDGR
jgi:hypothetical protein